MCRGDRPVAPTGAGDGDQPDCAELRAPASVGKERCTLKCALPVYVGTLTLEVSTGSADFSRQRMHA